MRKLLVSFMTHFTLPQYKNCNFILLMSKNLVQMNVGRLEILFFMITHRKDIKLKNDYAEQFIKTTVKQMEPSEDK